jgi:hypothetical protein
MKKTKFLLPFICIILLFSACTGVAKRTDAPNNEKKEEPTEIRPASANDRTEKKYFSNQQYVFSFYKDETEDDKKALDENLPFIEIIGWSKNGLVAYTYKTVQNEVPEWEYHFSIVDLVDDRVIEDDSFKINPSHEKIKKELSEICKTKWNLFLKTYGIIGTIDDPFKEIKKNNYSKFPINNFNCWFDYSVEKNKDKIGNLIEWKLFVGNNNVQKIINQKAEIGYYDIHGLKILGYYKSPYENRIAIFVSVYKGFVWSYWGARLYGCHMDVGLIPQ